jgi:DNA-binding NtrC family response regulator
MQSIFIAIDDQVISMLLCEELFEEGYSIRTFSDPWMLTQAVQKSRSDLIIMDEFFGGGRGIDLCLRFRKYLLGTTVIIWASWISVLGGKKKRLPANFHIFKTHTLQELKQEICRRIRQPTVQRTQQKPLVSECLLGQ